MSTPSAKPNRPTDTERSGTEPSRVEEPVRSPYAPKAGRGGAESVGADDDSPPPPRFLLSSRHTPGQDQGLTDFSDSALQFPDRQAEEGLERPSAHGELRRHPPHGSGQAAAGRPVPTDQKPAQAHGRDRAAAGRRDDVLDDEELRRLEESVRQLQREAASSRTRTAGPAVHPDDPRAHRRRGETFVDGYRVPPSLQPEILPPPPQPKTGRGRLQMVLTVVVASTVAAPIAYYFAAGGTGPRLTEEPDTTLASAEPLAVAPVSVPVRTESIRLPGPQGGEPETPAERQRTFQMNTQITAVPKREVAPPAETPAAAPPRASVDRAPAPVASVDRAPAPVAKVERTPPSVTRVLDPAAIEVLVNQGQQFIAAGDFVTARLVFQRAAEAGSAVAALALGATYDPVVLAGLGAHGVETDVAKARIWYQKAKEFGAPEAERRLGVLANR